MSHKSIVMRKRVQKAITYGVVCIVLYFLFLVRGEQSTG